MPPHPSRHPILRSQLPQSLCSRRVLGSQEEVVVLMQQGPVDGYQGLPLVVAQFRPAIELLRVNLDTLLLDDDEPRVDALHLDNELVFGDLPGLWLQEEVWRAGNAVWKGVSMTTGVFSFSSRLFIDSVVLFILQLVIIYRLVYEPVISSGRPGLEEDTASFDRVQV